MHWNSTDGRVENTIKLVKYFKLYSDQVVETLMFTEMASRGEAFRA